MKPKSPYVSFAFRCNKCQAHKAVNAPRSYPMWSDEFRSLFELESLGKVQGAVHGKAVQKRDEVDRMLKRMLAGMSHDVNFE